MTQISGFGSGEDVNKRWRLLLEQGISGILMVFDLPTQLGLDSDHPLAKGEVARLGVAVDTLDDIERALDLPFEKINYLNAANANAVAPIALAMVITTLEKRGISPGSFVFEMQNELLKEFVCRGCYIFPPQPSTRIATDVIEYCAKNYSNWVATSICAAHVAASGSTPAQEIAFPLSNTIAYLENLLRRGLNIDDIAPSINFLISAYTDFFEDIAKLRAARKVWARLMKERYGAKDPRSMMVKFVTATAGVALTAQQPLNNIARIAIQTLIAALSGVQYLSTACYDEAVAIPSEDAVRVSAAINHIIADEVGGANTPDPMAGCYYLEYLTKQIEDEALKLIDKVDELGGAVKAIEQGYFQRELARAAYEVQKGVESGKIGIVGVNRLRAEEKPIEIFRVDPEVEKRQIERLRQVKDGRDNSQVKETLRRIREVACGEDNLMPPIIEAVKAYATTGEISDTLREVFGEYKEDVTRAI